MTDITDFPPELVDMIGEYLDLDDLKNAPLSAPGLAVVFQGLLGSYTKLKIPFHDAGGYLSELFTTTVSARLPPMAPHIRRIHFINYYIHTHVILLDKDYEIAQRRKKWDKKARERERQVETQKANEAYMRRWEREAEGAAEEDSDGDVDEDVDENVEKRTKEDTEESVDQDTEDQGIEDRVPEDADEDSCTLQEHGDNEDEADGDTDVSDDVTENSDRNSGENFGDSSDDDSNGETDDDEEEEIVEDAAESSDHDLLNDSDEDSAIGSDEKSAIDSEDKPGNDPEDESGNDSKGESNNDWSDESNHGSDDDSDDEKIFRLHKYSKIAVVPLTEEQANSILTPSPALLQRMAQALRRYTQLKSINTTSTSSLPGARYVKDQESLRDLPWSAVQNWKQWGQYAPDLVDFWTGKKCTIFHRRTDPDRYPEGFTYRREYIHPPALELPKLSAIHGGPPGGSFSTLLQRLTISTMVFINQCEWDGDVSLAAKIMKFIPQCTNLRRLHVKMGHFAIHSEMPGLIDSLGAGNLPHLTHLRIDGGQYKSDHYEKVLEHRWPTLEFLWLAPETCVNDGSNFAAFVKLCRQAPKLKDFLVDFFIWGIEISRKGSGMKCVDARMEDRAAMKDRRPDGPGRFGPELLKYVYHGDIIIFSAVLGGLWPTGEQANELAKDCVEYFEAMEFG